jgi:glycosyltransferase involved in cell wall biosynthesis
MNIHFDNVNLGSSSGPNSFAKKLITQFEKKGYNIVALSEADISLCFIESRNFNLNQPRVQRLDGIYFNTDSDYQKQNANIKKVYDDSDGVVFQSHFNKKLITKYFGEPKQYTVIHNGADLDAIRQAPVITNNKYENIWCCAASWRPHKRLRENIRYFLEHSGDKDVLMIAGEVPKKDRITDPNIIYLGSVSQQQLYSIYKTTKYFIHLAWLDHCPNVVVDAYASGCQVICSSAGGTREIAGEGAIIIEEGEWDFEPVKLYDPPPLNFEKKLNNDFQTDYNMFNVANKYESFMESFLDS